MKNNRKNRKLNFIRVKNGLRTGRIKFYCSEKVSNQLDWNTEEYWQRLIDTAKKSLMKHWKLNLNTITIQSNICEDDFVKDLKTNLITLSLK